MKKLTYTFTCILLTLLYCGYSPITNAQLRGVHLDGDYGLGAGTQAPPSLAIAPTFYGYHTSKLKNNDGALIPHTPDMSVILLGLGGNVVTNLKLLNANYGAGMLVGFITNRIEGNIIQFQSSLGFTDLFIQPVQLGWHTKKADFLLGYGLYIPTGKYKFLGTNNKGLGMYGHEFSAATTIYFNSEKTLNFSSILFYDIHSKKRNTDIRAGNIFTAEGGLAKTYNRSISGTSLPLVFNLGAVYYVQYKVTHDKVPISDFVFTGSKDHIYALGLEANLLYPKTFTSISIRWLSELEAKNRFQGNTFLITIGQFLKSFEKK